MRKLLLALVAACAIALPIAQAAPSLAKENKAPSISVSEGIVSAWRFFSEYKYDKALDVLNYVRKNPGLTKGELALIDLSRLTVYRLGGNELVDGLPNQGIKYLTEAIVLDDTSAHARRRRGDAYCQIGNFGYCKRDYAIAWKLTKNKSPEVLARHLAERGINYQKAGRIQEGNADLREAARLYRLSGDPRLAQIYEGFIK